MRIIDDQWESGFRLILRINKKSIPDLFENHQESARINENQGLDLFENQSQNNSRLILRNHWESMRNQGLDLFENQWESIPDLFWESAKNHWESIENHNLGLIWESMRINSRLIWESLRIGKKSSRTAKNQEISGQSMRIRGLGLIWESIPDLFWESLRIGKNHQELVRIRV